MQLLLIHTLSLALAQTLVQVLLILSLALVLQVLLIHTISARGVPQADVTKPKPGRLPQHQHDNTSDPYARFVLMDAGPGVP